MEFRFRLILSMVALMVFLSFPVAAEEVDLVINGEPVTTELVIVNGRALISASGLADQFGAELDWDSQQEVVKVTNRQSQLSLKVGSRIAKINGKIIPLQAKIRLLNNQVLVPMRLVPKIYGGQLTWEGSSKTIYYQSNRVTDIGTNISGATSQVVIQTTDQVDYKLDLYQQPQRLVVDLYDVSLDQATSNLAVNNQAVKQIRVSQFKFNPAVVRVVVDLKQISNYQVRSKGSGLVLEVESSSQVVTSSIISQSSAEGNDLKLRTKRIVVDPGHGGMDPGAIGPEGVKEKTVNYQIAAKVNRLFQQEGFRTQLTRDQDQFQTLANRSQQANNWGADAFVSIHANSNPRAEISGSSTYAHWYASEKNWALAWYVQSELQQVAGLMDKGLKAANFSVLRKTEMPAILVETAFLSNPREEELLASDDFQQQVAQGIVAGIKEYFASQKDGQKLGKS
ncbi:N-acetylmuramoyl-L-alanine amidase [Halanaerobaculum tunisiense]